MQLVDYDLVAPAYDKRYERNRYDGVRAVLQRFIGEPGSALTIDLRRGSTATGAVRISQLRGVQSTRSIAQASTVPAPDPEWRARNEELDGCVSRRQWGGILGRHLAA
jgi:hypothetical protein